MADRETTSGEPLRYEKHEWNIESADNRVKSDQIYYQISSGGTFESVDLRTQAISVKLRSWLGRQHVIRVLRRARAQPEVPGISKPALILPAQPVVTK
jgi:hypothetical protein